LPALPQIRKRAETADVSAAALRGIFMHVDKEAPVGMEQIRSEEPVPNTIHNLIQTLSVKLDSAARYGLYQDDARKDGMEDCAEVFSRLAQGEQEAIQELMRCLKAHLSAPLAQA
jgi:hypothetical protein